MTAKLTQVMFQQQPVQTPDGMTETQEIVYAIYTTETTKKFKSQQIQAVVEADVAEKLKALLAYEG